MGVNSPGDRNLSPSLLRGRCLVTSVAAGRSGSLREGRNMTQPELSSCR